MYLYQCFFCLFPTSVYLQRTFEECNTGINDVIKRANFTFQRKATHLLKVHLLGYLKKFNEHHNHTGLLVIKHCTAVNCIYTIECSLNFDGGFTRSHTWPDVQFKGETNGGC